MSSPHTWYPRDGLVALGLPTTSYQISEASLSSCIGHDVHGPLSIPTTWYKLQTLLSAAGCQSGPVRLWCAELKEKKKKKF